MAKQPNDDWETLSMEIVQWQEEGQVVEGTLEAVQDFEEGKLGACKKYIIVGADGIRRSCVLGGATDRVIDSHQVSYGDQLRIVYQGKKLLPDDRKVNLFDIKRKRTP